MSDLRNLASWAAVAAAILFGPVIAFVVLITAEMLTDLATKAGPTVVWPVAAAAMGWVLLRRFGGLLTHQH